MAQENFILALLLIGTWLLLVQPVSAEVQVQDELIYQTAFTTNPDWITNSPRSYYWDSGKGMYHYAIEPGTGGDAYIAVDYSQGAVTLEYDVTPISMEENSAFRLAFSTTEMDRTKGTIMLTEFTNAKYGKVMWLRTVTPSNKLYTVNSAANCLDEDCTLPKYSGTTVRYTENRTYHVVMQYDDERQTLSMRVIDKAAGTEIWGYYIAIKEALRNMNRIVVGTVGDYSDLGPVAEGYIDNVRLTLQKTVTVTPAATTTTLVKPTVVKTTAKPTVKPTTAEQTPTPESPLSSSAAIAAASLAGVAILYGRSRQNR
jgi:hypothetical protein